LEYLLKTEAVQFTPLGNNLRLHPRGVNWKTTSGLVLVKAYFSGEKTFEYGDKVLLKEKLSLPRFGKIKTKFKIKSHRKLSNVATNHEDRPFRVEIIRSEKRRRTISARLVKDIMYVYAPAKISDTELKNTIDSLKRRLKKKKLKHNIDRTSDLKTIAERINREYFNGGLKIKSIEYSTNQLRSFGCCNYKTQRIRISHRLWQMPAWVQDYVILHEMAHLIEPNHSKSFWDIVFQYKLTERAKGYLMAKGFDSEEESGGIEPVEL
ncbi:MAG: M48 family metallopeptidase, partial [Candidatus Omnitrophica bacterium]|nr:M48 family metallopeptidase [Candidatus Omnitrophota bacterium]